MSAHPPTPAHAAHLVRRALGSIRARPLSPLEESEVAGLVGAGVAALFWAQPVMDQRHGIESARFVLARRHGARREAAAALMHDVGKRHARLGVAGRVVATLFAILRLPAPGRLGTYLDHARLGAADLLEAGADPLVVAYARFQDDVRPPGFPAATWALLKEADGEKHRVAPDGQYDVADGAQP